MENQVVYPAIQAHIGEDFNVNGLPMVVVPNGCKLESFPALREYPSHTKANVVVCSAESFIGYFNRFKTELSVVFVDIENMVIRAVIDYHSDESPNNCLHSVTYECPLTPEAKKWVDNDKKQMSQFEFASFIEENLLEIIEPSGSEMLEITSTLHAKNQVSFRSGVRTDNGQVQMTYQEEIQGSAGVAGQLTIPQKIKIALKIFRGDSAAYAIEANFRYRVKEGKLTMWYELIRPHLAKDDAVKNIVSIIKSGIGDGVPMFEASINSVPK